MSEHKPLKIINRKTVWEGRFVRALLLEYMDDKGAVRNWEAVERVNCEGIVAVIPITAEGDLLLIRQFRPTLNSYVIELPAGLNDKGETLIEAAWRELIEETGYISDHLELVADGPVSTGLSTETMSVFLATDAVPATPQLLAQYPMDEAEDIELIKTPLSSAYEKVEELCRAGNTADLKIYGFIALAQKKMSEKER
jgi:8-oxo-dGTP pyrophosphatase MutT (NUDIX family)